MDECNMSNDPPVYELREITDFQVVPPDRRDACLAEFKIWLAINDTIRALNIPVISLPDSFIWVDDDQNNVTIIINGV